MRIYILNSGWLFGWIASQYAGRMGWLMTPHSMRYPDQRIPYVFDNGVWSDFINDRKFDENKFWEKLKLTLSRQKPEWVVVPDMVSDRGETISRWKRYAPSMIDLKIPMMMAVQDGMNPNDVPKEASGVFVGGSTEWKWKNLKMWTDNFSKVHVGRVNTYRMLNMANDCGAESVDGSGWFRGDQNQIAGLQRFLEETTNTKTKQQELLI
tara:strand:- start:891 stop:1517 length:627 start_codon:yes stop_codon:yes gene_type:complete